MTLRECLIHDQVKIRKINLPISMKNRLLSMGVYEGQTIRVFKNDHRRSLVIKVKGAKVIVDHSLAEKIFVESEKRMNIMLENRKDRE